MGPTLANAFLSHYDKIWLEWFPKEIKPLFYKRYVDDIIVLFESQDKLIKFRDYFNRCRPNISFSHEVERDGKLSFLDANVFREERQFLTNVYRKPTFSGVYTHFESVLPTTYKFRMVYTFPYRCFRICSDLTKFNQELRFLKDVFLKNGYPSGFIDSCFKKIIDNFLTESPVKLTVEKRLLILLLPFLGDISLQLRTNFKKSFKNILSCCKV